jgi:hypothetical protein
MSPDSNHTTRRPDRNRGDLAWPVLFGLVLADTLLWLALPFRW